MELWCWTEMLVIPMVLSANHFLEVVCVNFRTTALRDFYSAAEMSQHSTPKDDPIVINRRVQSPEKRESNADVLG